MGEDAEEEKPWQRRRRLLREQQEAEAAAAAGAVAGSSGGNDPPAHSHPFLPQDLQDDIVSWYRNTFIVTGAALVGSMWQWNVGGGKDKVQVFVPPRAASLPAEVVDGWRRSVRFREGVRAVGRQTLLATGVAAVYFGVELGCRRWRDGGGDYGNSGSSSSSSSGGAAHNSWADTAAGGAAAGGLLGTMLPGAARARGACFGAAAGACLGAASGAAQQWAAAMAPEGARHAAGRPLHRPTTQQHQQQEFNKHSKG